MKAALLCTALLVAAVPGYADEAIRTDAYSPQSRTSLVIQQGRVTNITFNVMERIKRIVAVEPGPISTLGKDSSNQEPLVNNLPIFGKSPGATNLVTGLATAHMDSTPVVAITGQVSRTMLGRDAFQETDIIGITQPITKHNRLVEDVSELALDVLRHRIVLSYEALADDVTPDVIITKVLGAVAAPDVVLSGR